MTGAVLKAYHKCSPKPTENDRQTERNVTVNLGQPAPGADRQGCEHFLKATEGLCSRWGWTL